MKRVANVAQLQRDTAPSMKRQVMAIAYRTGLHRAASHRTAPHRTVSQAQRQVIRSVDAWYMLPSNMKKIQVHLAEFKRSVSVWRAPCS